MIDYLTLIADNLSDDYAETFKNTAGCKINDQGAETYYDTKIRSLYLKLWRSAKMGWKLAIKGSIKHFQNGENFSFMDFTQTAEAIQSLAAFVGLSPQQLRVTSLEVSVPVATAPIDKLVKGYGKWEFMPMLVPKAKRGFGGRSYGVTAVSPYAYTSIKLYQKNEEQHIRLGKKMDQLQQVEFCIDKARYLRDKLNKLGIASDCALKTGISLNYLTKPAIQAVLCDLLLDIPNQITLKTDEMPNIDTNALLLEPGMTKTKLLHLIAFADSRRYREVLKNESRSRYFEVQKEFARLRDQLCPASDQQLRRFQQALQAAVEAGKPKSPFSPVLYSGKQSRKKTKIHSPSPEPVNAPD
jgi:hypothetical protein